MQGVCCFIFWNFFKRSKLSYDCLIGIILVQVIGYRNNYATQSYGPLIGMTVLVLESSNTNLNVYQHEIDSLKFKWNIEDHVSINLLVWL